MKSKISKLNKIVNEPIVKINLPQDKKRQESKTESKRQASEQVRQQQKGARYKKIKKLGQGSYGTVSMCYDHHLKTYIALKKIKFTSSDEGIPITTMRQITALKNLNHQNIIQINDVHYQWIERKMFINLEYMNENLEQHIKSNFPLPPNVIKNYLFQIVNAVQYMNLKLFVHRDLKPLNILVNDKGNIKICDFGESKIFTVNQPIKVTENIGTLWYKAPEMLLGSEQFSLGIDVWSIGAIFAEMALGQPIFKGDSEIGQIFKIFRICGTPSLSSLSFKDYKYLSPSLPKFKKLKLQLPNIGQQGNNLLQQMLQLDPAKRIPIGKILRHDYFQGL